MRTRLFDTGLQVIVIDAVRHHRRCRDEGSRITDTQHGKGQQRPGKTALGQPEKTGVGQES